MPNSLFGLSVFGFLRLLWLSVWFYSWMPDRVGVCTAKEVSVGGKALCSLSSNKLSPKKALPLVVAGTKIARLRDSGGGGLADAVWVRTGAVLLSLGSRKGLPR